MKPLYFIYLYILFDISECFVACDLKVGRYIQSNELMKLCEHSRSRSAAEFVSLCLTETQSSVNYCSAKMIIALFERTFTEGSFAIRSRCGIIELITLPNYNYSV